MELLDHVDQEERRILVALSQVYSGWERKIGQRGIERSLFLDVWRKTNSDELISSTIDR